jgi:hypothetical protein
MFKPVRVVATILLIGSIVLVFIGAFVLANEVSPIRRHIYRTSTEVRTVHMYQ